MVYTRIYLTLLLMLLVLVGYLLGDMSYILGNVHKVLIGIFLLFLPGYWISLLYFDVDEIVTFERGVMSLMISCSLIPFLLWYWNYFHGSVTIISGYIITGSIIWISILAVVWKMSRDN